jgi:hypothetical protein
MPLQPYEMRLKTQICGRDDNIKVYRRWIGRRDVKLIELTLSRVILTGFCSGGDELHARKQREVS